MSTKKCFPVGYRYNIQPIQGNPNKTPQNVLLGQEDIKNNRQIIYESLLKGKEEALVIVLL